MVPPSEIASKKLPNEELSDGQTNSFPRGGSSFFLSVKVTRVSMDVYFVEEGV